MPYVSSPTSLSVSKGSLGPALSPPAPSTLPASFSSSITDPKSVSIRHQSRKNIGTEVNTDRLGVTHRSYVGSDRAIKPLLCRLGRRAKPLLRRFGMSRQKVIVVSDSAWCDSPQLLRARISSLAVIAPTKPNQTKPSQAKPSQTKNGPMATACSLLGCVAAVAIGHRLLAVAANRALLRLGETPPRCIRAHTGGLKHVGIATAPKTPRTFS